MTDGSLFSIDEMDVGPDELPPQLPVRIQPIRNIPGSDRPDYVVAVAQRPIAHRTTLQALRTAGIDPAGADPQLIRVADDGAVDLTVFGLVLAPRLVGDRLHPGMNRLPVNLAYVVDNSVLRDDTLDLHKVLYAAVVLLSDASSSG